MKDSYKGFKMISGFEMAKEMEEMKKFEETPHTEFSAFGPRYDKISYEFDDECFKIVETLDDGKSRDVYIIEKNQCWSIDSKLDWLLQLTSKTWVVDAYRFKKEFAGALRKWFKLQ